MVPVKKYEFAVNCAQAPVTIAVRSIIKISILFFIVVLII